jgi:SAM-dependent methyltransferase
LTEDPAAYGERFADVYDSWPTNPDDVASAVSCLAELAGDGPALELGIGTGRLALPLVQTTNVAVTGIDASEAMVAKMRAKSGGDSIDVRIGDFADFDLDGQFTMAFIAFNTFYMLPTQEDQLRCFRSVARHLRPGGRFVIEGFIADLGRYVRGQCMEVKHVDSERTLVYFTRHDATRQILDSQFVEFRDGSVRAWPMTYRYVLPAELDLMAQLAGMSLEDRWSDWDRTPFTAGSGRHVSVYALAPE